MSTTRAALIVVLVLAGAAPGAQAPVPPAPIAGPDLGLAAKPFLGDFEEMRKRRMVRVGVAYNRTHYFIDHGVQRGLTYESFKLFEDEINAGITSPDQRIHVLFVPMSRDKMADALLQGHVDLLAANLTITPERRKLADWSDPIRKDVNEIVVTGPGGPMLGSKADLSGQEVLVRENSTYHEHLVQLSNRLVARGLPAIKVRTAPMNLEDDDILEMVHAGLARITVVDNFLAEFWAQVFPGLILHPNVALTLNGEIAAAMRPNSPQLKAAINAFIKKHGAGSLVGNMLLKRYLSNTKFAKSATSTEEMARFRKIVDLFRKYGDQYSVDYLLMAAQGFQESGLNQQAKSRVGAVGVMQVMPATGKELAVGDIGQLEPNIHAGVKYIRFMIDEYFKNDPMNDLNKTLMAFASYNAGPNRIRQLRAETKARGLDPNVWFNNVEQIVSERIGRETVTYVSNIYKYYIAYRLSAEQVQARKSGPSQK